MMFTGDLLGNSVNYTYQREHQTKNANSFRLCIASGSPDNIQLPSCQRASGTGPGGGGGGGGSPPLPLPPPG